MNNKPAGIYIHIPFCKSKCPYCDFYSVIGRMSCLGEEFLDEFTKLLIKEIEEKSFLEHSEKSDETIIDTVYFGGGTPSLLEPEHFEKILEALKKKYLFQSEKDGGVEITVECNPRTLSEEKLIGYRKLGINRISLGAQSMDENVLKSLGRIHREKDIIDSVNMARKAGFNNISIDLMFGIPGQSMETWQDSLRKVMDLKPEHISFYSLEFMDGTRFTRLLDEGKMTETEPELDRKMYEWALKELEKAGIYQYEISNAAVKGYQSRHNSKYWKLDEYYGYGPSAHSFVLCHEDHEEKENVEKKLWGKRFLNSESLEAYKENPNFMENYEDVNLFNAESEFLFTGLRMNSGISKKEFKERFGEELWSVYSESQEQWQEFVREGFAMEDEDRMKLSISGFDISNQILCLFV